MGFVIFFGILFVILVGGGWLIGSSAGKFIGTRIDKKEDKSTFIDNSVHYHYHTHDYGNKSFDSHIHQNLTIIDEETHKKGLDYFSDKNESRNG